jgi:arginine decarboxylase
MANRITTVGIIPYPPGIPILMPGENVGPDDGPWLTYLRVLQAWDNRFPGFESVVEGTVMQEDVYHVWCIK